MKCKVCNGKTKQSGHQHFVKCESCGSYSNKLDIDMKARTEFYTGRYNNERECEKAINQDLKHWNKTFKKHNNHLPKDCTRIIDIAGGFGLPSSVLQSILKIPVTLIDSNILPSTASRFIKELDNKTIVSDAFEFLKNQPVCHDRMLVLNSHFIEHLESDAARSFISLIKSKFPNSYIMTYCPAANAAKKEKNYFHFTTPVPSDHRLIWSKEALCDMHDKLGIKIKYSRLNDCDIILIGELF
jgi:hypothetical protein